MSDIIRRFQDASRPKSIPPLARGLAMLEAAANAEVGGPSISSAVPRQPDETNLPFWPDEASLTPQQRDGLNKVYAGPLPTPGDWASRRTWTPQEKRDHLDRKGVELHFERMARTAHGPVDPDGNKPMLPPPPEPQPAPVRKPQEDGSTQRIRDLRASHEQWMADSQDRIARHQAEVAASMSAAREQPVAADNAAREAAAAEFSAGAADGDARITEGMRLRAAGANPAQEVSVPTQEQAEKWKTWVSGSAARQERYDPAAADARFEERAQKHREHRDATMAQYGVRPETLDSARVPPHIRRKQWMKEVAVRYKDQLAKDPSLMHKLVAEYDAGISESGAQPLPSGKPGGPVDLSGYRTPHFHGAASARNLTDVLDAQKAAQIATNVQRGWDQTNAGRQLGMSRGQVMAMQDIQESLDKGDKASAAAKMAMYGVSPHAYKGMLAVAEADVKKEATTPGVVESYEKERGRLDGIGAGDGRLAAIDTFHRQRLGGKEAPPDAVQDAVRQHYQPYAQEMASRGLSNLSPEERIELQQATRGMDYTAWLRYCGQGDTPENRQAYRDLSGRGTGWGDMGRTAVDWMVPDWAWNGVFGGGA